MKFSLDLKKEFTRCMEQAEKALHSFNIKDRQVYGAFLAQTYYYVCHSTRLLALSASRLNVEMNAYHYRFAEHIREEKEHEIVALRDLKALGLTLDEFPEFTETAAFYGVQYYWIEHKSSLAMFGYILALEGMAAKVAKPFYEQALSAFGKEATQFLKLHASEDQDHLAKALKQIEAIPAETLKLIIENMHHSMDLYCAMLRRANEGSSAPRLKESA